MPESRRTQLRVGRLTKAHGLKGAIKLELYTDDPERRFVPGAVFSLQVPSGHPWHGRSIELTELRWYNAQPVGFFKDVPDRTAAEALVKGILWVDQDAFELPEEENAWYDHQLVGLDVERDGLKIGVVVRVDHFPAQDLLIVKTESGEVMVPFVAAIVPSVDMAARVVTVTPPTGLFEEIADDDSRPDGVEHEGIQPDGARPDDSQPDDSQPDDSQPDDSQPDGARPAGATARTGADADGHPEATA